MPAEGAMQTEVEAPGVEPRDVSGGVRVSGVEKAFGPVRALAGVTLHAAPREVVAVVGPSGCGKSTLLELVCGLAAPDAGTVESAPAALMPQRDGLLPWLTALDVPLARPRHRTDLAVVELRERALAALGGDS